MSSTSTLGALSTARPQPRRANRYGILPGFGLSMGFTVFYLSLIVLIPLSTLFFKSATLSWDAFWGAVSAPRVVASYRLTFGAALVAALVNLVAGLAVSWTLVRYDFPGKRIVDALVDLPFALPTAVAGISLTALYASNGWMGRWLEPLGVKVAYTPLGVVVAITPFNGAVSLGSWKLAPALAMGNTVILKPPAEAPGSSVLLAELALQAGFPKGAVNVVIGDAAVSEALATHPGVAMVSFTGSTATARILGAKVAAGMKRFVCEAGGKSAHIVFEDADLEAAVRGAVASKFRNAGQTCVCTNRFFVQEEIHDRFVEKLVEATSKLKVGPGLEEGSQQGPLIDEKAVEKVEELLADATSKGAKVAIGGKRHALGGTFFEPTVITGASPEMRIMEEEIFGPVSPIFRFKHEEEAVAMANATSFGLACYFYTSDLGRAFRVMEGLKYGLVGVNEGLITTVEAPFGGFKESGLGKEGGYQGIEDYLDTKYVCIGGLGL